ncbi:MAG: PD-(D/E)XK nuclease family protein, partial [Myxococcota bacterium]
AHAPEPSQHGEPRREELGKEWLPRARLAAASALRLLQAAPDRAPLAGQFSWLRGFLEQALGWGSETPGASLVEAFFQDAAFAGAEGLDVSREEFRALLLGGLDGAGRDALGGAGGGVQVLSVMEARGLCFESIYLLGVNRGSFPRSISEDPLLPDALRVALRAVLPDLPVKREGHDEERFLFAQLLGQAPEVFLSWAASSEDAAQLLPSALLEGARAAGLVQSSDKLPPLHAVPDSLGLVPRPAAEHALLAGVHGGLAAQGPALAVALAEEAGGTSADASAQAAARLAVAAEYDRYGEEGAELGPYFGFVGARAEPAVDGSEAPSVTFVEQMARCPWSAFLQRVLRVRPPRDAMAALPSRGGDSWLLGNVVHRALEVLVREALPGASADLEGAGTPVPRPGLPRVEEALLAAARHELRDAAIPIPGYARVLARAGLPMVTEAFEVDWSEDGSPHVLGVEVAARVEILDAAGTPRALRFRADRVDRVAGALRLSDYKTGRSKVGGKKEDTRRKKFLDFIANGALLQGAVYANLSPGAEGRYLYLDATKQGDAASLALTADPEVQGALGEALAAVLDARDAGAYVPRLLDIKADKEPRNCERCEVKQACLRGDSSATGRIRRFLSDSGSTSRAAPQRAAARLLRLREPTS